MQVADLTTDSLKGRALCLIATSNSLLRIRQTPLQRSDLKVVPLRCLVGTVPLVSKLSLKGLSLLAALGCRCQFDCRHRTNRRLKSHTGADVLHAGCDVAVIRLKAGDLLTLRCRYFARLASKCLASLLDTAGLLLKASNLLLLLSKFSLDVRELLLIDRSLGLRRSERRRKLIRESCPTIFSRFCGALEEATIRCLSEDIIHHAGRHWIALCLLEDFLHLGEVDLPCGTNSVQYGIELLLGEALVLDGSKRGFSGRHWLLLLHLTLSCFSANDSLNFLHSRRDSKLSPVGNRLISKGGSGRSPFSWTSARWDLI